MRSYTPLWPTSYRSLRPKKGKRIRKEDVTIQSGQAKEYIATYDSGPNGPHPEDSDQRAKSLAKQKEIRLERTSIVKLPFQLFANASPLPLPVHSKCH